MKTRISFGWSLGLASALVVAESAFADSLSSSQIVPAQNVGVATPASLTAATAAPQSPTTPPAKAVKTGDNAPAPTPPLSSWALEIQKLQQAGVDQSVILLYITNCAGVFNLSPDQIIYLKNVGISAPVMNAMIWHDQQLIAGTRSPTAAASPPSAVSAPSPAESPIVATAEPDLTEPLISEDDYYAPEQPADAGPVRAPYPVKLNDPIIILKLPTFAVPCW